MVPLKLIEYGFGYISKGSPYTPYSTHKLSKFSNPNPPTTNPIVSLDLQYEYVFHNRFTTRCSIGKIVLGDSDFRIEDLRDLKPQP